MFIFRRRQTTWKAGAKWKNCMSSNLPMAQRSGDLILSPIFLLCLQFFILIKSVYVSSFSLPFSSTPSSYSSSLQLSLFSSPFPLRLFILLVFSLFHPLIFNTACVQIENFFFNLQRRLYIYCIRNTMLVQHRKGRQGWGWSPLTILIVVNLIRDPFFHYKWLNHHKNSPITDHPTYTKTARIHPGYKNFTIYTNVSLSL